MKKDPTLPNPFSIALGKRIQQARMAAGLSQTELAEMARVFSLGALEDLENGNQPVDERELFFLSLALDQPVDYFLRQGDR